MSYLGRIIIGKSLDSRNILYLRDERRDLKKRRYEAEGAQEYREAKKILRKKKRHQESTSADEESNFREAVYNHDYMYSGQGYKRTRNSQQLDRILLRDIRVSCGDTAVLDYNQHPEENPQVNFCEEVEIVPPPTPLLSPVVKSTRLYLFFSLFLHLFYSSYFFSRFFLV